LGAGAGTGASAERARVSLPGCILLQRELAPRGKCVWGIHGDRGRDDLCTTKRKTDMLKADWRRCEGLVRSCRATKLAANYGGGWWAIVQSITPSIHGHFDPLKLIRERQRNVPCTSPLCRRCPGRSLDALLICLLLPLLSLFTIPRSLNSSRSFSPPASPTRPFEISQHFNLRTNERRPAFLPPNSRRLSRWLPHSSQGRRPSIRSADPPSCRCSTCPPSRRPPRSMRSPLCRPSAMTSLALPRPRP
jgi:hypothetical protein